MIRKFAAIVLFMGISLSGICQNGEPERKGRPDIPGTFTLELGVNRGLDAPSLFDIGFWGSRTVNIYYQYEIRILNSKFSLVPGIGLSMERYKFTNGRTIRYASSNAETTEMVVPTVIGGTAAIPGLRKSQLITNYVEIPVELRFSTNPDDPARSFKISAGGRVGYLYDAFTKVRYKDGGEIKKLKDKQNYNLNQLRYGIYTKIGIGNFSIFGYYNLSPLFEEDKGLYENSEPVNFSTFTAGISLSSF